MYSWSKLKKNTKQLLVKTYFKDTLGFILFVRTHIFYDNDSWIIDVGMYQKLE